MKNIENEVLRLHDSIECLINEIGEDIEDLENIIIRVSISECENDTNDSEIISKKNEKSEIDDVL